MLIMTIGIFFFGFLISALAELVQVDTIPAVHALYVPILSALEGPTKEVAMQWKSC